MVYGDVVQRTVTAELGGLEEQFEVHHVVDDDRIAPSALGLPAAIDVPRLDHPRLRVVARGERAGRRHHHGAVGGRRGETQGVAVAAIDHESHVVVPSQILHAVEDIRMTACALGPLFVAREAIHIPKRSGEKAAHPVVDRYVFDLAVGEGRRNARSARFETAAVEAADLRGGDGKVLFDEACSGPSRRTPDSQGGGDD